MSPGPGGRLASLVVGVSTAVLIVAVAVLPFLTPAWLAFAQDRADAAAWTGYDEADLRAATNALLHDVVLGPPAFDVEVAGEPVLTEAERAHLRDVRGVFGGLAALALAAAGVLVVAAARARGQAAMWRSARTGALALSGGVVVLGVVAVAAFEPAFDLFHRLLFAGNFTFDPQTDRLVQLFPGQLWFETAMALGAVIVALGLIVAWLAGRQADARLTGDRAAQPDAEVARPDSDVAPNGLREARP